MNRIKKKMKIHSMKKITKQQKIQKLEDSDYYFITMKQHIGQVSRENVKIGEEIKMYQRIGEYQGIVSSKIHSPVSGKVRDLIDVEQKDGTKVKTVVIQNDFKYEQEDLIKRDRTQIDKFTKEEIYRSIEEAGIVGAGGAQFPTHVKYNIKNNTVETLILNGAECEPYLTSDYTVLNEYTSEFLDGLKIVKKILEPKEIILVIGKENKELAKIFKQTRWIKVVLLPTEYPQSSEKNLIKKITKKEIKQNQLPLELGVIVSNVSTIKAIYDAVIEGIPQTERVVTISGELASKPGNYLVKIGTPLNHIIDKVKPKIKIEKIRFIYGGPMMGTDVNTLATPTTKGTSGILYMKKDIDKVASQNCISCGYCMEVCPMRLMPMQFDLNYKNENYKKLEELNINVCIECGACGYICPSKVPLMESIKLGKQKLKEAGGE